MLYQSEDYRDFINSYVKSLPGGGHGKLKEIAKEIGIHPTSFSQVLKGRKSLNIEQAIAFTEYAGFSELDSRFFINLVEFDRAANKRAREYFQKQIHLLKEERENISSLFNRNEKISHSAQSLFYSNWYYSGIRLLSSIEEFQRPEQISKKLNLDKQLVNEVLDFLVKEGLCNVSNGNYTPGPAHTHLSAKSEFINAHRINWRLKAINNFATLSSEEIAFSAPMSISRADFNKISASLRSLIKEAVNTAISSQPEDLVCLNIDWIKV